MVVPRLTGLPASRRAVPFAAIQHPIPTSCLNAPASSVIMRRPTSLADRRPIGTETVEGGARITGDIAYEAITIDTGAQVDGQLRRIVRDEGGEAALIVDARPEDPLRLFNVESPAA